MIIKNLFFDLDGTLTDSSEGIVNCAIHALKYFNLPIPDRKQLLEFIGPPLRYTFPKYVKESDVEKAVQVYRERYVTIGKFENKPYDGIHELLANLKNAGYNLFVATSKTETQTYEILEKFDLLKYFTLVAGAMPNGARDSKASVIRYLISQIENFDGAYMIGDTIFDIVGANECNLPSIAVGWGFGDKTEMLNKGAEYFAETMLDLKNYLLKE